jgi:hypothetical protein
MAVYQTLVQHEALPPQTSRVSVILESGKGCRLIGSHPWQLNIESFAKVEALEGTVEPVWLGDTRIVGGDFSAGEGSIWITLNKSLFV